MVWGGMWVVGGGVEGGGGGGGWGGMGWALSVAHLLNDVFQVMLPAIHPLLKELA